MSFILNKKKLVFISVILLIIDIISKRIVSSFMEVKESIEIIDNIFYLTYARNEGVAFSFLEGNRVFIIIMSLVVIGIIIYYLRVNKINLGEEIGFGLVIGGALGNLIDRVMYGYVIDFIDIYIFGYDYPIFNIADIGVVIGVIVIIISSFKKRGDLNAVDSR